MSHVHHKICMQYFRLAISVVAIARLGATAQVAVDLVNTGAIEKTLMLLVVIVHTVRNTLFELFCLPLSISPPGSSNLHCLESTHWNQYI